MFLTYKDPILSEKFPIHLFLSNNNEFLIVIIFFKIWLWICILSLSPKGTLNRQTEIVIPRILELLSELNKHCEGSCELLRQET